MQVLKQHIEALIFVAEQSITIDEIASCLKSVFDWDIPNEDIISTIEELKTKYNHEDFSFELAEIANGYQFLTKKEYQTTLNVLLQQKAQKRLSTAALETLSIIAYKQPVTKSEVEQIRGVDCNYSIQKLLEKDLIEIKGKSEGPGKAMQFVTSKTFMEYFGIKNPKDLPQLKDIAPENTNIAQPQEVNEAENAVE
ncbi:MAG: SMC-Scp complex subunit ScpB [Bacteroidota bacterium]